MQAKKAIRKINENGILLVFPINNREEPNSLWAELHPRTKMRWEWTEDGDDKVGDMWLLMKHLSDKREVVYSKWYQSRATFFSRDLFAAMLCILKKTARHEHLSFTARNLLDALESDSPLSTKELKKITDLRGRDNEPEYQRGMKALFNTMLIVAFGEVDDGAFPSLAVGSTELLYEDLSLQADEMKVSKAQEIVDRYIPVGSLFRKYFDKIVHESSDI